MNIKSVMHIAFYTDKMDEMISFYTDKIGAKVKVLTRFKVYTDRDDRPQFQAVALKDPERIFNVYLEIAPGQFLELFPKIDGQVPDSAPNTRLGYSHYALLVDDIYAAHDELVAKGVSTTDVTKGPSGTYQFWTADPDGNPFEYMQYTETSYQVVGHID